jgi:hypothetical protein
MRMRWAPHVEHVRGLKMCYRILVGEPEGKRPLTKLRLR